jgi:hypothetical protein
MGEVERSPRPIVATIGSATKGMWAASCTHHCGVITTGRPTSRAITTIDITVQISGP